MRHSSDPTRIIVEIVDVRDATAINEDVFNLHYNTTCYNHGHGDMTAEFRWDETIDDPEEFASELIGRIVEANGEPLDVSVDLRRHDFFQYSQADRENV